MQSSNQVSPINTRNARYALSGSSPIQPNRYRTRFNAFERQVKENDAGKLNLNFAETARTKALDDLDQKAGKQSEAIAGSGPDTSTFLPTFQASLGGEKGTSKSAAQNATAENLRAFMPEFQATDIDTAMEDDALSALGQKDRAGYLNALMLERGGGLSGMNQLDAAILDKSGAGRRQFDEARKSLVGMTERGDAKEAELKGQYDKKSSDLEAAKKSLIEAIGGEASGLETAGQKKIQDLINRAITPEEIEAIMQEAKAIRPDLDITHLNEGVYEPFIDRQMGFDETLSGDDAEKYNYLMELMGKDPVNFRESDPFVNRAGLLSKFLDEGEKRKVAADYREAISTQDGRNAHFSSSASNRQKELLSKLPPEQQERFVNVFVGMYNVGSNTTDDGSSARRGKPLTGKELDDALVKAVKAYESQEAERKRKMIMADDIWREHEERLFGSNKNRKGYAY
jgi:hypothetical protein